jgi:outer membrane protein TolC
MHVNPLWNRKLPGSLAAILMLSSLEAGTMAAQTVKPSSQQVSLEQAIARAKTTSESVTMARAGAQRARAEVQQARSSGLPQLALGLGYTRTLESEFSNVLAGDSLGAWSGLSSLPFGQENRYELGVTASHTLYSGGRVRARADAAVAEVRSAEIGVTMASADVDLTVTEAYYDALLADRFVAIAESTLAQAEATLAQVSAAGREGVKPDFDIVRARVSRDQQLPVVIEHRSSRDLAYMRLKQLLDLDLDAELQLTTPLADNPCPPDEEAPSPAPDTASAERAPVQQAAEAVIARERLLDAARAQRKPSITLQTQYARVAYPGNAMSEWGDLRSNWTAGFSVQLPLFTGGRIAGETRAAEARLTESRARLQQTREAAVLDARRALERLEAARAVLDASAGTVLQAERAYAIAQVRFNEGLSTQIELSDARLVLEQARMSRAQAVRDYEVAATVVRLLPALPMGAGTVN